ncbi:hypothetical protein CGRA01v4_06534 [Colletotrichum graminicola]|uniref:Uncharacterized protein n=1 Tax=Colletotrichum graminicola (strain M1.001 / M2 / FGSC 10212) TaxID=645133 RepID=E3Q232_COLGM|nr:uncharacterized protein GLRG_00277 [Colletotrichum graminicola M1.001]EFQ25133.1 hypothetical protein GLRG_00277 [Colletotrichum graminicola M1.001]WDK15253.1 hypothetical protein CGRA01v4_06534 [Colletotrichum graminicola]
MAKRKTAPAASSSKAGGDDTAPATQQPQQQAGNDRPTTQLGRAAAFLMPPAWMRRIMFVAVLIYLTPMLLAHWIETSTKLIGLFRSFTSGR